MTDTNVSLLALMSQNTVSPGGSPQGKSAQETGLPEFGNLLSQTDKVRNATQVAPSGQSSTKTADSGELKEEAAGMVRNSDAGKKVVKEAGEKESAKDKIAQKLTSETATEDAEPVDVEEVLSQIADQIVQIVSQGLGVDEQQLMNALEELGLGVGDLLDSSNLANVFRFFGEDIQPLELLMNSDFQNVLTELKTFTEELAQQMDTKVSEAVELLTSALEEQQVQQEMPEDIPNLQQEETVSQLEVVAETVTDDEIQGILAKQEQPEVIVTSATKEAQLVTETDVKEEMSSDTEESVIVVDDVTEETSTTEEKDSDTGDLFEKQEKNFFHEEASNHNVASTHTQSTAVVTPEGTVTEQTVKVVDLQNLVTEITEYVKLTSTSNQVSSIEMQLNPANLGKVLVEVATQQGEVTAKIATQTEAAKEAMEANVNVLRENLEQQGVKVSAVEVTVQSHAFEENLQEDGSKEQEQLAKEMQKENRRVNVNLNEMTLDDLQGLMSEEDLVIAKMMRDNGNVINIGA